MKLPWMGALVSRSIRNKLIFFRSYTIYSTMLQNTKIISKHLSTKYKLNQNYALLKRYWEKHKGPMKARGNVVHKLLLLDDKMCTKGLEKWLIDYEFLFGAGEIV